ncbi:ribonuclease H-like domain-containing protein [Bradymonas sediminis]|nr:ribonuclease H-like domain-containing protein [Bradymonas sediminis]TDP75174.1 RNase H superfamily protein [Bradymonas sediminis]
MPSGFKKRLTRLHASRQRLRQTERAADDGESRVFLADDVPGPQKTPETPVVETPTVEAYDAWAQVGAKVQKSARGPAYYLHQAHSGNIAHGRWRLEQGRDIEINGFCDKFPALFAGEQTRRLPEIAPHRLAFVDLETNGLSKKSYPFCVGIGLWEDGIFSVYHFLMRDADDEPAVLAASVDLLRKTDGLCTFNGASFDVPMLKRRCELHGIAHPFDTAPHIDLLRISRKLYAHRKSHKLSKLEEDLLDFGRVDDVPGAEIPRLWSRYLKAKNPRPLLGIFEHNRLDILSMVVLFSEFDEALNPPTSAEQPPAAAPTPAQPPESTASIVSAMNQSLARSYALRKKSKTRRGSRGAGTLTDTSPQKPQSSALAPAFSRGDLNRGMPIGGRLRILRAEVEDALERSAGVDADLLPRLHEMLALAPRHPFALEKIVDYYRQTQQTALARHFEKRLQDVSPF